MEKRSVPKIIMLSVASLLVCLIGCQSTHTGASQTRDLSQQGESFDATQRQPSGYAPQQYFGLQPPTAAAEAVVTARVKDRQQDCDQCKIVQFLLRFLQ